MTTRKNKFSTFLSIFLALSFVGNIFAIVHAEDEFRLNVKRTFGYNLGEDIQGSFSLEIIGNQDIIQKVSFTVDGKTYRVVGEPPFQTSLDTGKFDPGYHGLAAVVITKDNRTVTTAERKFNFLTVEQAGKGTIGILVPILGVVFGVMAIGFLLEVFVFSKRSKSNLPLGASRSYGINGGGICPKCKRPFSLHFWGLNLIGGKFDRCPYCGKWSVVRPAKREVLAAAEAAELQQSDTPLPAFQAQKDEMKELLDDSRFSDQ